MASRFFAGCCENLSQRFESKEIRAARAALVGDLTGDVLEVGAGAGANFPFYGEDARVIATDYSPHMLRRAQRAADGLSSISAVEQADAQKLPFPDDQFDHAVATLVFCSVPDAEAGLREILRVTKPGGAVRLLEHTRADGAMGRRVQNLLTPAWHRVFDGCHLNRETVAVVATSGLTLEAVEGLSMMRSLLNHVIRAQVPGG